MGNALAICFYFKRMNNHKQIKKTNFITWLLNARAQSSSLFIQCVFSFCCYNTFGKIVSKGSDLLFSVSVLPVANINKSLRFSAIVSSVSGWININHSTALLFRQKKNQFKKFKAPVCHVSHNTSSELFFLSHCQ